MWVTGVYVHVATCTFGHAYRAVDRCSTAILVPEHNKLTLDSGAHAKKPLYKSCFGAPRAGGTTNVSVHVSCMCRELRTTTGIYTS